MDAARFRQLVGDNIRRARWLRDMTQQAAAEAAGLTYRYYVEVERGERNPTLEVVHAIAKGLGVAVADLVDVAGARRKLDTRLDDMKLAAPKTGRKPRPRTTKSNKSQ